MPRVLPLVLVAAAMWACTPPPPPILVEDRAITVQNQTSYDWRNVRVVVNDHFVGGVPALAAGARMTAPLGQFQTAYGQPFERGRQSVKKVEVTATDSSGAVVALKWPDPKSKDRRE